MELTDAALCSLIESSAILDKPEFCDFFIKELAAVSTYHYNKAFDVLVPVLRKGYFDVGLKFFSTLTDPHPRILMEAMCFSNMPTGQEARFLRLLKKDVKEGPKDLFIDYIGRCLLNFNYKSAINLLPYLKEEHEKLGHMGFYPFILYCKNTANYEKALKKVVLPNMPVTMDMVTLLQSLWPSEGGSLIDVLEKHSPLSAGQVDALRLAETLTTEGPGKAATMLPGRNVEDIPYTHDLMQRSLFQRSVYTCKGQIIDIWRDQLKFAAALKEKNILIRVSGIVLKAMAAKVDPITIKEELLKLGLLLTRRDLEKVLPEFDKILTDEERKKLSEVEFTDYSKMSLEELRAIAPFHNARPAFQLGLLMKSAIAQDYKAVGEVLERNQGMVKWNDAMVHRIRADYALRWKNDPMEAFTILKTCAENSNITMANTAPYLSFRNSLACELWRNGHFEEAIETFSLHSNQFLQVRDYGETREDFVLFDHAPQNHDQMLRLVSAMCKAELFTIQYRRKDVLLKLVKAINKSDLTQVLQTLPVARELLVQTSPHWVLAIMDLLKPFLKKREDLKALYEECTKNFEEKMVLVALAAIHLEVAELVKFQKIIQTPGLILDANMLKLVFLRWKDKNPSLIEEFEDLTKGLPGNVGEAKDLCELLHRSSKTDATNKDVDDCVAFFTEKFGKNMYLVMQDRTVAKTYLAFLRKHGRPPAFNIDDLRDPMKFKLAQRQDQRRRVGRERFSETLKGEDEEGSVQLVDLLSTLKKR